MINPKGTILPYRRFATKGTPAFVLLPLGDFIITLLKIINAIRLMRPTIRRGESITYPARSGDRVAQQNYSDTPHANSENRPAPGVEPAQPGLRRKTKEFLRNFFGETVLKKIIQTNRKFRYTRRAFLHDNLGHEWYAYFVFRKVEEVEHAAIHITSHYKELDQT